VPATGGVPTPITALDASNKEVSHRWPYFLPDARHFLYAVRLSDGNHAIYGASLDSNEKTRLLESSSMTGYANPGYLIYNRQDKLFAQQFDAKDLVLKAEPFFIADQVRISNFNGQSAFAVSQNGVLIYRGGAGSAATQRFTWYDRGSKDLGSAGEPGAYSSNFDLSLDGKQLVVNIIDSSSSSYLWLMEWARGVITKFTDYPGTLGNDTVWSPDGSQLAFSNRRKGNADIYVKSASGLGAEKLLVGTPADEYVEDWSKDGRYIVYVSERGLWVMPLFDDGKPVPIVQPKPFENLDEAHFSFDTKWIAYSSNESGTWQVYVISFPGPDQRRQISTAGGAQPRWKRDGKELYYLAVDWENDGCGRG
jgi:eukaryotic-like serine/threonine-protein kinase